MLNNFVPEFLGLPNEANQVPPLRQIEGQTATVSTLVTVVGHPKTPMSAGNGGFNLGFPCFPSIDSIKAVSSPQIYAPAPRCTKISKSYPDPHAFFPIRPASYASLIAICKLDASL